MSERGTGGEAALATPRPWRAITEGSYDQRHAAAKAYEAVMAVRVPDCDGCQFTDMTWLRDETDKVEIALVGNGPKATQNAALIVEAVNNYDRLRRIEAAARGHVAWEYRERGAPRVTLSMLRAALTSSQPTPAEPEKEKE